MTPEEVHKLQAKQDWDRHFLHFGACILLGAIPTALAASALSEGGHKLLAVLLVATNVAAMKMAKDNGYNLARLPPP